MNLDCLVIAAHPDDAEISVGGTILRMSRAGARVGVVDVTRGEMGSRGDRAQRDAETAAANEIMGLAVRENLEQPDGRVEATLEAREALAGLLRKHRPRVVLAHAEDDLHPDHAATGRLAREAWYLCGLRRLAELAGDPPGPRPERFYRFMSHVAFEPTFVVDVSPWWEEKLRLVRCYASQLAPQDERDTGAHLLFGADIVERATTKARYFGEKIGVNYGEPLLHEAPLPLFDPLLPG